MMSRVFIICGIVSCLIFSPLSAQNTFTRVIVPPTSEQFSIQGLDALEDGFLVGGYYQDTINSRYSSVLVKIDTSGALAWAFKYQDIPGTQYVLTDIAVAPYGIYISGYYRDSSFSSTGFVSRLDLDGNLIWTMHVNVDCSDVICTADSGCAISGGGILTRMDKYGSIVWSRHFGLSILASELLVTDGGDFVVAGKEFFANSAHPFILRVDGSGNLLWHSLLELPPLTGVVYVDCAQTTDGGFAICSEAGIAKVDQNGALVWANLYTMSNSLIPDCIIGGANNEIIVTASVVYDAPFWDQMTFCLDSNGVVTWTGIDTTNRLHRTFGLTFNGSHFASMTSETNFGPYVDHTLVVSDTTTGYICGDASIFPLSQPVPINVLPMSAVGSYLPFAVPAMASQLNFNPTILDGCTMQPVGLEEYEHGSSAVVFPNPASAEMGIVSSQPFSGVKIYSAAGQLVFDSGPVRISADEKYDLNVSGLTEGIYLALLETGTGVASAKFTVVH